MTLSGGRSWTVWWLHEQKTLSVFELSGSETAADHWKVLSCTNYSESSIRQTTWSASPASQSLCPSTSRHKKGCWPSQIVCSSFRQMFKGAQPPQKVKFKPKYITQAKMSCFYALSTLLPFLAAKNKINFKRSQVCTSRPRCISQKQTNKYISLPRRYALHQTGCSLCLMEECRPPAVFLRLKTSQTFYGPDPKGGIRCNELDQKLWF